MPPKKRARVSQATSPAATDQHKTPTPAAQSPGKTTDDDILNDPWTDEEAIGLFKAIIKWKPTGIHKHFRMLQIRQYLLDNRYISPKAAHTTSAGLWAKLATLYDLESLDQREDARQLSDLSDEASNPDASDSDDDDEDLYSLADNKIHKQPFSLPDDDAFIEDLAWKRRFPSEKARRDGSESPAVLPEINMDREAPVGFVRSLRAEMDVPSEEEPATPEPEEEKRPRGRPKGSTSAKAGAQAPAAERRRSTRQVVEPSDEEDEEEEESEEGEDEDEEDEEEEEDSSEEEEDGSEETTPAPRPNRSGRGRGRPARGTGTGTGNPEEDHERSEILAQG